MPFCDLKYRSSALEKQTAAQILLPDPSIKGPYNVMFLLHGLSDDCTNWARNTSIERYLWGLPLIVVMPDGGRGWYCDAEEGYNYQTAIGVELPELIRGYFPTKEPWCSTGLSMGGYGAAKLALAYPKLFKSAHSMSGALGFGHKAEYLVDERSKEFLRILGQDSVGGPNDLYALSERLDSPSRPMMRIDCGTEDFLIEDNRAFSSHLSEIGFDHEYEEFPGDHSWPYWDLHVQDAIAFHRKNLGF